MNCRVCSILSSASVAPAASRPPSPATNLAHGPPPQPLCSTAPSAGHIPGPRVPTKGPRPSPARSPLPLSASTACFYHDQATMLIFSSVSTSCIAVAVQEKLQASTRCLKYATCPISSPSEHEAAAARQCLVNDRPNNSSAALPSPASSLTPHARAVHLPPRVRALHHLTQSSFRRSTAEAENGV